MHRSGLEVPQQCPALTITGLVQLKFGDADKSTLNDGVIGSH